MSYIDRKTLIEKLRGYKVNVTSILSDAIAAAIDDGIDTAISVLSTMPDAEAEPIRHGEWVRKEDEYAYWYECSECGGYPLYEYDARVFSRYCPNCGALMLTDKGET